ncbi:aryldialkylphosphatase [soil metagenome]
MDRRYFLTKATAIAGTALFPYSRLFAQSSQPIHTVLGPIAPSKLGSTLIHEHILVDFIGADQVSPERYDAEEAYQKALPFLQQVKQLGCTTLVECTPAYLGRDVQLLRRLSEASGLHIITNTGYYGAVQGKFIPEHAHQESEKQIAERWIREFNLGIENSGIKPGFIKTGVDKGALTDINKKLAAAAALTHLQTGLTISGHTGDGTAAMEQIEIIREKGVAPSAFRWVHAQNERDTAIHAKAARLGAWVEFDGISPESLEEHVNFVLDMKKEGLLNNTLISHDAGWYNVGDAEGGNFRSYQTVYDSFIPALQSKGFSKKEINQLMVTNPRESLTINIRKI